MWTHKPVHLTSLKKLMKIRCYIDIDVMFKDVLIKQSSHTISGDTSN